MNFGALKRMSRSALSAVLAMLILILGLPLAGLRITGQAGAATRPFTVRYSSNKLGDVVFVSNTLMTCTTALNANCTTAQGGTNAGAANNNNGLNMQYIDVDSDTTTINSSRADLNLPTGSTVLFAGLYWGGISAAANRNQAKLQVPGATTYATVTASQLDFGANDYQGFADITASVAAAGNGTYTVANVQSTVGANQYAGWTIVVAYEDPAGVMRNLTVFDGYQSVANGAPQTIPVSGFITPPNGAVNTKLGVVAYEGDRGTTGDVLSLNNVTMSDALNPADNFFNSSITNSGADVTTKNPNYINQLGYDADILAVPNAGNAVIANNATSATIRLSSTGDVYYPGVVTFVTDLYSPKMTVTKTASDVNGGTTVPGDQIEYTITVTNTGDDSAVNNVLTDVIPSHMSYVPGSIEIVSGPNTGTKTDVSGDDVAFFDGSKVTAYLGTGATSTGGGELVRPTPGNPTITVVKFRTTILPTAPDGVTIPNTANLAYTAFTLGSAGASGGTAPSTGSGPVKNNADLGITKTNTTAETVPGQTVTYDIVVTNTAPGNNAVAGATVVDTLPAALTGATWTCAASAGSSCAAATGAGNINTTVNLAVGGTATYTVTATLASTFTGNLVNAASVTAPTGVTDPSNANNSSTSTTPVTPKADLSITKTDGNTTSTPGSTVTYAVVASNAGPSAVTGATVSDTPPNASGPITWSCVGAAGGSCPASGTGNLAAAVNLPVNGTATFTISYTVDANVAAPKLDNTATITAPATVTDPTPTNNTATDSNDLVRNANFSITKTHPAGNVVPGTNVTYTITVNNAGPSTASTASVTDTLPAGMSFVSISSGSWTCPAAPTGQTATCTGTNIPVGTSTITVVAAIDPTLTGAPANAANVASPDDTKPANNSATDVTALTPDANLSIAKTHSPASVVAGNNVTYTITVNNPGPSSAANVAVTDTLPSGLTLVTATPPTGWACTTAISCTVPNMDVGTAVISVVATLDPNYAAATVVNNASVASPSDSAPGNNSATDTANTSRVADVRIAKSHTGAIVAGSPASYTIVVSNNGPSAVTGASVSDVLPAQLTNASWTCAPGAGATCPASGSGAPSGVLVNLAAGASATFTLNATVAATATADFVNTANVTVPAGVTDPAPTNNSTSDTSTPSVSADLSISKTDSSPSAIAGTAVTYTIVASNSGPSAVSGATVTDNVPATLLNPTWTCAASAGSSCPASGTGSINAAVNLSSGGTATFTLTATLDPAATGSVGNTATITAPAGVTDAPGNNSATDTNTITTQADVRVAKTDNAVSAVPGTATSYTITVTNAGPSAVSGVTLNDAMPSALMNPTWTCAASAGSSCPASGSGDLVDAAIALAPNGTATFTVNATLAATATGDVVNTAKLTLPASVVDPVPGNNEATDTTTMTPRANVGLTKTDGATTAVPGSPISYTITATNAGPSAAPQTHIVDNAPSQVLNPAWTCVAAGGATCPAASGAGSIDATADLAVGASLTYTLSGTVDPTATGNLVNSATATLPATVSDPDTTNNNPTDTDTLVPTAELSVVKTNTTGPTVVAGTPITYNVVVKNSGPSFANGVTVADALPASLTGATWTCTATANSACAAASGTGSIASTVNLAPNGEATFVLTAIIATNASGSIANTATVTYPATLTDPTPGPTESTDTAVVGKRANLRISKTDGKTDAIPGAPITYTIVVTNDGPSDVVGAVVKDAFPATLTSANWSCVASAGSFCTAGGGTGSIDTTANLISGGTVTYTVNAVVAPSARGTLANTATVTAPLGTADPTSTDDRATDTDTLIPSADLGITKTDGTNAAIAGNIAIYTIEVTNNGPSSVDGAVVKDVIGSKLINPTWTCVVSPIGVGNSCINASGTGDIDTTVNLNPGAKAVYTVRGPINPSFSGTLINTATVATPAGVGDPTAGNNTATDQTAVTLQANVSLSKTDNATSAVPGTPITYTIQAINAGPSNAPGVRVVDNMPAGLLNPTWTCEGTCPSASGTGSIDATFDLPAATQAVWTVTGTVDPAASGTIRNSATVVVPPNVNDPDPSDNTPSDQNDLVPTADLTIVKKNTTGATVSAGTPITYTIDVTNAGPSLAKGVQVTDTLPSALMNALWTCSATGTSVCGSANGTGTTFPLVDVASGETVRFTVNAMINPAAKGTIANTATVVYPTGLTDPTPGPTESTDTATVEQVANLRLAKTNTGTSSTPGTKVTYLITVTNDGPSSVTGARVVDTLPASLINATWTCAASAGSVCGAANGTGSIDTTTDIATGGVVTYTLIATVDQSATADLTNTASVTPPPGVKDPNPDDSVGKDTDTLTPTADLSITKTDNRTTGVAGETATYTIVVSNAGPSAVTGARVRDAVGTSLIGATWTCVVAPVAAGNVCPALGNGDIDATVNLLGGASATFTLTGTVPSSFVGKLTNTATLTPPANLVDPVPGNNTAADDSDITAVAGVSITKTNNLTSVIPGNAITYTVTAANAGPSDARGVRVRDNLPATMTNITWTCAGTCTTAVGTGNVDALVDLPAKGNAVFTIRGVVDPTATGTIANTATATVPAAIVDPITTDNSATDSDKLSPTAELSITKSSDGGGVVGAGDKITYTVTVSNAGPSAALGLTVRDIIPSVLSGITWTCTPTNGSSCTNASGSGDINEIVNMAARGTVTFIATGNVPRNAIGTITNTAEVTYPPTLTDPTPGPTSATDVVRVVRKADLAITKTDSSDTAIPGTKVTYTIVASNAGPADVTDLTVTDSLPSALINATWTCTATGGSRCVDVSGTGSIANKVDLLSGGRATYVLIADIDESAPAGSLANSAAITAPVDVIDPTPSDAKVTDTNTLTPSADVSLTKTDGKDGAIAGSDTEYTIVVSNAGPSKATATQVTDVVAGKLLNATWTCVVAGVGNSCGLASGTGDVKVPVNLLKGASATIKVKGTIDPAARGNFENIASAKLAPGSVDPDPSNNESKDATELTAESDVQVWKVNKATDVTPGGITTYDISVVNVGPSTATGVTLIDEMKAPFTDFDWSCFSNTAKCVVGSGKGSINVSGMTLPPKSSITFTVRAKVGAKARGDISNTASITATEQDPNPANNSSTSSHRLVAKANLAVTKTDNSDNAIPGQGMKYTITATNSGPSDALGATIVDKMPASLKDVTWTCVGEGGAVCPNASGTGDISEGVDLPVGGKLIYTVIGTPSSAARGKITNSARIVPPSDLIDTVPGDNDGIDNSDLTPYAGLRIEKSDNKTKIVPGEQTTYTITVHNDGPSDAPEATMTDMLPKGLLNPKWQCLPDKKAMCLTMVEGEPFVGKMFLPSGSAVSYFVTATIDPDASGAIVNTAITEGGEGVQDTDLSNNTATDKSDLIPDAELSITKSDDTDVATPGKKLTYKIDVTNGGPSGTGETTVVDKMPSALIDGTWTCAIEGKGTCAVASGKGDINTKVKLSAKSTAHFIVTAMVDPNAEAGDLVNTVNAKMSTTPLKGDGTASATDTDKIVPETDVSVKKTHTGNLVAGDKATYTIVVSNKGPSTAKNVAIEDALPASLKDATWTCVAGAGSICSVASGSGDVKLTGTVKPGAPITITLKATVDMDADDLITNTAKITLAEGTKDISSEDDTSIDDAKVTRVADVSVTKDDASTYFVRGREGIYAITVKNDGPSGVKNIRVRDELPAVLQDGSWTCEVTSGKGLCQTVEGTGSIDALVDLSNGSVATFYLKVTLDKNSVGDVRNTATVTTPENVTDKNLANNRSMDKDHIWKEWLKNPPKAKLPKSKIAKPETKEKAVEGSTAENPDTIDTMPAAGNDTPVDLVLSLTGAQVLTATAFGALFIGLGAIFTVLGRKRRRNDDEAEAAAGSAGSKE